MNRRTLRLELVAALGVAFLMPAMALSAQSVGTLATQTVLSAETHDLSGHTQATVSVTVTSSDGMPVTGAVVISDQGKPVAGVALNALGQATDVLDLAGGVHDLSAAYAGDATHQASASRSTALRALIMAAAPPDFSVSVAPATLSLTAGNTGTLIASVTPTNNATLTGPMFVALSCSGLPDQASCSFTPENLEIQSTTTTPLTSTMQIQTYAASSTAKGPAIKPGSGATPINWAILLPGILGLGGLAFGVRRRRFLSRLALVALVGLVTILGTTGCNPRYNYEHHGPLPNPATPSGVYTVTVTAQSSNGVTATTHSTTMVLTIK
jgi:hypothetical protein